MSEVAVVSKGMAALRRSNQRAERVTVAGELFCFRKLTIEMEDELDAIVKANQDPSLKPPEKPADDAGDDAVAKWADDFVAFKQRSAKAFRKLTAELMKYLLLDECDKPLFSPEDDVYGQLNNVYAENFFKAYTKFRQGAEAGVADVEKRFQG